MEPNQHKLKNDSTLLIREVALDEVHAILGYLQSIGGESDFLTFGPGEFEPTVEQEDEFIRNHIESENQLFILGLIDHQAAIHLYKRKGFLIEGTIRKEIRLSNKFHDLHCMGLEV